MKIGLMGAGERVGKGKGALKSKAKTKDLVREDLFFSEQKVKGQWEK